MNEKMVTRRRRLMEHYATPDVPNICYTQAQLDALSDESKVWVEITLELQSMQNMPDISGWYFKRDGALKNRSGTFGYNGSGFAKRQWRAWLRRPTDEEREAVGWE